jgi:hypothetical protein
MSVIIIIIIIIIIIFSLALQPRFLEHTQRRATFSRTPLDE